MFIKFEVKVTSANSHELADVLLRYWREQGGGDGCRKFCCVSSVFVVNYGGYLIKIGGSSNGRTEAFEAFNRGPNPCPPACERSEVWCGKKVPNALSAGIRTAEYKIFTRKFFEPVPRQIFAAAKI